MYAIVLAGGSGSRLWPRSRRDTPKQLLTLLSDRSLLQETVDRLRLLMPVEHIVVVTGEAHAPQVAAQVPDLPPANVLVEPAPRGTAPAIGLGLLYIERLAAAAGEANPVVGSFHADHVITDPTEFATVVREAAAVAEQGLIVTLGITPDRPHTGYGYIERGALLPAPGPRAAGLRQREMAVVQCAHGGNQRDSLSLGPPGGDRLAQGLGVLDERKRLHYSMM